MTVVLIGLMGVGKSTVGSRLARRIGVPLVDVDREILDRTGRTVRELWLDGGEAAYRAMESGVVLDALHDERESVVAAPGGVILDAAVRTALTSATVIWLRASPATLGERVRRGDHRPLLGSDPETDLARMAHDRDRLYAGAADLVVDTDEADPDAIAERIAFHLGESLHPGRLP